VSERPQLADALNDKASGIAIEFAAAKDADNAQRVAARNQQHRTVQRQRDYSQTNQREYDEDWVEPGAPLCRTLHKRLQQPAKDSREVPANQ